MKSDFLATLRIQISKFIHKFLNAKKKHCEKINMSCKKTVGTEWMQSFRKMYVSMTIIWLIVNLGAKEKKGLIYSVFEYLFLGKSCLFIEFFSVFY
jgi:hypothetical protein